MYIYDAGGNLFPSMFGYSKTTRKPKKNKKNKVLTHYGGPGLARMTLIIAAMLYIIAKIMRIPPKY